MSQHVRMRMDYIHDESIEQLIGTAMREDVGAGDVTSDSLVPADVQARARIVAKEPASVCGLSLCRQVFRTYNDAIQCELPVEDGDEVQPGETVLELQGSARSLLTAERVALNFLQRLSGVATLTRTYVQAVSGTGVAILDTRKTTPGFRTLEKYAVLCGGGQNHRMGLYDHVMIKDNHRLVWTGEGMDLAASVEAARKAHPELAVEIEVDSLDEYRQVLSAKPEWILLDNMTCDQLRACVDMPHEPSKLEASGGVTLETVRAIAETGVDAISVGALTHSAPAVDFSLEFL